MRRMFVGVAIATTVGCSAIARQAFTEPAVSLRDVRVVGLGLSGGELDVVLGVYNPNNYRLDTSRLTYRVFVGDTIGLASGEVDTRQTVQAADSTVVHLPVTFTYAGLSAAGRQLLMTGSVNYRVTGDVTVPFSATGRYSTMRRQE